MIEKMALSPRNDIGTLLSPKRFMEEEEKKLDEELKGRRKTLLNLKRKG